MGDRTAAAIREAIADHGPISFAEFMELALYGPGGFYDRPPVGERGHFVTSPHVHPVFGRLLASGLRAMWEALERPDPFDVIEVGAGDGTLAGQVMANIAGVPARFTAVERSAGARAALAELPVEVVADVSDLGEGLAGCVFANELLDNFPFARARGTAAGPVEVRVGLEGERFVEVERPAGPELLGGLPDLAEGREIAISRDGLHLIDRIATTLRRGYAILIDYATEDSAVQVHGYRWHRVVEEVLADPGSADITAGVDLGPLIARANELGLKVLGPVSQRSCLQALGFTEWSEEERIRQTELMDAGRGLEAVRAFGGRSRASLLVDPAGLGNLRWLLLATQGCTWPGWAREATGTD